MSASTVTATNRATGASKACGRTVAAHREQAAVEARPSPQETEGAILRTAACLSQDLALHPGARASHISHISGMLGMAVTLGALPDDRAVQIRSACVQILDGAIGSATPLRNAADPAFAAVTAAVRRHGGASLNEPLAMAGLDPGVAAQYLGRLIAARIVGGADASGFHPTLAEGTC